MITRRLSWLLAALCSLVFLGVYQKWLAWLVTGAVFLIPLFSLLVSLPAMLTSRLTLDLPAKVEQGQSVELSFSCNCPLPAPLWSCRVEIHQLLSGEHFRLRPGEQLLNPHCGGIRIRLKRVKICDYLGIFSLPLRGCRENLLTVTPRPVPLPEGVVLRPEKIPAWKPKAGGFSENHELRAYRPGDSIRQIHWKLSAKTGGLIIREPMVPNAGGLLVRLVLQGAPDELDRKLGRALWLGQKLLEQNLSFCLQALSAEGLLSFQVHSLPELDQAMTSLLSGKPALSSATMTDADSGFWKYDIGGEPDET